MRFTVTRPVKLQTPSGPKLYQPGECFQANAEKAKPYIEKGLLRQIEFPNHAALPLAPGQLVEWDSPLFGKLKGQVMAAPGNGSVVVVDHPVMGEDAILPKEWIT